MFTLTMLTSDGKKHNGEYARISLPTDDGVRTILANHMDVVVPVEIGKVKLIKDKQSDTVVISEGIFNFKDNQAHLFVRTFEFADEIDKVRAKQAKERAEARLQDKLSTREMQEIELALKRALTRLNS